MCGFRCAKIFATALFSAFALAACGGGSSSGDTGSNNGSDGSTAAPTTPLTLDGFYDGSTSSGQTVTGAVLADNSFFLLYSAPNDPNTILGAAFGPGTSLNGSFSSNAEDIKLDGTTQSVVLSASYEPKNSFNGSLAYPANTVTFTTKYNPAYETVPALAALAGTYTGTISTAVKHETLTLTVDSAGNMTGPLLCDCNVSAVAKPLATGNAYSVLIKFSGGDAPLSSRSFTGTAYLDTATNRLILIGSLDGDNAAAIYVGKR